MCHNLEHHPTGGVCTERRTRGNSCPVVWSMFPFTLVLEGAQRISALYQLYRFLGGTLGGVSGIHRMCGHGGVKLVGDQLRELFCSFVGRSTVRPCKKVVKLLLEQVDWYQEGLLLCGSSNTLNCTRRISGQRHDGHWCELQTW